MKLFVHSFQLNLINISQINFSTNAVPVEKVQIPNVCKTLLTKEK